MEEPREPPAYPGVVSAGPAQGPVFSMGGQVFQLMHMPVAAATGQQIQFMLPTPQPQSGQIQMVPIPVPAAAGDMIQMTLNNDIQNLQVTPRSDAGGTVQVTPAAPAASFQFVPATSLTTAPSSLPPSETTNTLQMAGSTMVQLAGATDPTQQVQLASAAATRTQSNRSRSVTPPPSSRLTPPPAGTTRLLTPPPPSSARFLTPPPSITPPPAPPTGRGSGRNSVSPTPSTSEKDDIKKNMQEYLSVMKISVKDMVLSSSFLRRHHGHVGAQDVVLVTKDAGPNCAALFPEQGNEYICYQRQLAYCQAASNGSVPEEFVPNKDD